MFLRRPDLKLTRVAFSEFDLLLKHDLFSGLQSMRVLLSRRLGFDTGVILLIITFFWLKVVSRIEPVFFLNKTWERCLVWPEILSLMI